MGPLSVFSSSFPYGGTDNAGPYRDWNFLYKLENPQDGNDETDTMVTSVAWAQDYALQLVVSYLKQGVV